MGILPTTARIMRVILPLVAVLLVVAGGGAWFWLERGAAPPLRVGTNVWPGYEPLYLARELGYYRNRPIRLLELRSTGDVTQLLRAGSIEVAALTLDETLSVLQDGFDLGVIAVMDVSQGGDVLLARPSIATLAQLKGKRIGVESSAVGAILLDGALAAARLRDDQVEIVPLTVAEHEAAYRDRRIDAVVTFEPVATRLREQGARVLFDSRRIPDRIVDVLVVRRDLIRGRESALEALLDGYFQALAFMKERPRRAAELSARRLNLTPAEVQRSYRGLRLPTLADNHRWLSGEMPVLSVTGRRIAAFLVRKGLLRHAVDPGRLAEPRFLPEGRP